MVPKLQRLTETGTTTAALYAKFNPVIKEIHLVK
jgi:hypothetical protein